MRGTSGDPSFTSFNLQQLSAILTKVEYDLGMNHTVFPVSGSLFQN